MLRTINLPKSNIKHQLENPAFSEVGIEIDFCFAYWPKIACICMLTHYTTYTYAVAIKFVCF